MSQAAIGDSPRVTVAEPRIRRSRHTKAVLRVVLMAGGLVLVAAAAFYTWLSGGQYVSTDDAYVQAAKLSISTDVSGIVASVAVREGQFVRKGDVLFRLDDRPFRYALEGAQATLAQTGLTMEAMKHNYQRLLRDAASRQAQVDADEVNYGRYARLVQGGSVTRADNDNARFKLESDRQAVDALNQEAQEVLARLGGDANVDVTKTPEYLQAQARLDEARRELQHAVVYAPLDGIVTNVDALQPGLYLPASTGAFGLVSRDHVWVQAFPKETQITWAKPGDHVDVTVDTYPGHVWDGVLESISPASGSSFSLLPAQNTSGNWVKVVQRIPLRVRVDRHAGDPDLRDGMSVEVDVDTGHHRSLSGLL